jgi:hypothetical protein
MVYLSKAAAELSVYDFKVEAAPRDFAEQSTVVFSAECECVQLGTAEANLALPVNHQPPPQFTLNSTPRIRVYILRADVFRAKPTKPPNCGREGRVHNPLMEPKTFAGRFEERKYRGLLFGASKRLTQGSAQIGCQPAVMKVRHRPRLAGC